MRKKVLIMIPIVTMVILVFIFAMRMGKKITVVKNNKNKADIKQTVTTGKNDEYSENVESKSDKSIYDEQQQKIDDSSSNVGGNTTKTSVKEKNNISNSTHTTQNKTTKTQNTTLTSKVTTVHSTNQCISGKFSSPFFRGDFKNDEAKCHFIGNDLVNKSGKKHTYECEYEFDNCNEKWWMLIMYDENDNSYYYGNFNNLYPQYK